MVRSRPGSKSHRRRSNRTSDQSRKLNVQTLEKRELLAGDLELIAIKQNSGALLTDGTTLSERPRELTFQFTPGETIDPATLDAIQIISSGGDGTFGDGNEQAVSRGFVGLGDSSDQVVFRFGQSLTDERYQISILGSGSPLTNTAGTAFNDGIDVSQEFELDLGATVQAVVPQPVVRDASGAITQLRDTVHVYFNDDTLNQASAEDPKFYQLIDTAGTLDSSDDTITLPQSVTYDSATRMAVATFASDIPDGTFRLKIGTSVDSAGLITEATNVGTLFDVTSYEDAGFIGDSDGADDVDLYAVQLAAGDSLTVTVTPSTGTLDATIRVFDSTGVAIGSAVNGGGAGVFEMITIPVATAGTYYVGISSAGNETYDVLTGTGNTGGTTTGGYQLKLDATASVSADDDNSSFTTATSLGGLGASGQTIVGQIEPQPIDLPQYPSGADEPGHRQIPAESHGAGSGAGVAAPGSIPTLSYFFPDQYGTNPQGLPLFNEITENQKDRAREIYEIFADLYGIEVREGLGTPIITGDIRAFQPTFPVGISLSTVLISGAFDWGTSPFGGGWMGIALHEIGHNAIGLSHSYDLPSVQGGSGVAEDQFPGNHDIVHGRRNHRPDATDIDMYRFDVNEPGTITAEIVAERLNSSSLLDSALKLYRQETDGSRTLIAQNDDYFSDDAYIELEVDTAGTYFLGVTSTGNTDYNPAVSDSGFGGISDGNYELKLNFQGASTAAIVDQTGKRLDGDADGEEGGTYEFDFRSGNTLLVDKASTATGASDGSASNPYLNIDDAIAAATAGDVIRIVANGGADDDLSTIDDNKPYLIGLSDSFTALEDGSTLDVPQDVLLQVDAGATLKLQSVNLNAGSSAQGIDRSGGAIQILGTPENNVILTAYGNDAIGGDSDGVTDGANSGDWGGIVFRDDSDFIASDAGTNVDDMPITLNYVNQANISFGGGLVSVNGTQSAFTPIHLIDSRPTVSYNTIQNSAQGALSASPDSFSDSRGRIGPDIVGNVLANNSINGLVIRGNNATGGNGSRLNATARFDDTDIVHVFTENLEIAGNPGGQINPDNPSQVLPGGRLAIDPGVVVKLSSARIEGNRGSAHLIAEGTPGNPVIFTSLLDDRYGGSGTFDTSGNGSTAGPAPGDWSGLVFNATSRASIDNALISYAGGESPIAGGLSKFNTVEAHHRAKVRVANSVFRFNADGNASDNRDDRGTNQPATIFVRQAQPIIVNNVFTDNEGSLIDINAGAMISEIQRDTGRSTGLLDVGVAGGLDAINPAIDFADNTGPLIRHNRLDNNGINGLTVRGGKLTTESVWDDTDIVHVLRSEIIVDHHHTYSGLQLRSGPAESLVVKLSGANAGFTADGVYLDIEDRIGGTIEVLGRPGFPVVLTDLNDSTVGAGLKPDGFPIFDTAGIGTTGTAGAWRSLRFNQRANDRNVRTVLEDEPANNGGIESNDNAGNAQSLGELAKDLKSGDDNRALGFEVHGFVSADDSADADLYSFNVDAGTEVWIDLDRTAGSLDAVVELVQQDGTVLASSIGANRPSDLRPDLSGLALPLEKHAYDGGDFYTQNFQDPGFRVVLPGNVGGTNETYFVRVTSEGGLTSGEYQLQVRLRQVDEKPGSTVQFADIRYATNAIEVSGLPFHSILAGETGEAPVNNNTTGSAQELGNLLESDRNLLSIAGNLPSGNDVDTFHLNIDYATTIYGGSIQAIPAVSGGPKTWSTVFDVDYADGLTRSDTSLFVYAQDPAGNLVPVLVGRESNVTDDQPGAGQGIDLDDLTRGSAGQLDPFIGPVQLNAGNPGSITDYYTAITSNSQLLKQLNQTYIAGADNPLVRLEPVDSVTRVAEDHIGFQGYDSNGSLVEPRFGLFDIADTTSLTPSIRAFDLSDIPLYVSSGNRLQTVNPLFGDLTTDLGPLSANGNNFHTQDIVFRSDGTMWAYQRVNGYAGNNLPDNGTAGRLVQLDPGNGNVIVVGNDNVLGRTPTPLVNNGSGNTPRFDEITFTDDVAALAWERSGGVDKAARYALYYSVIESGIDAAGTETSNSKLYRANPDSGSVAKNANLQYGVRGDLQPDDVTFASGSIFVIGTSNIAVVRVEARSPGTAGNGISVNIVRGDLTGAAAPAFVSVAGSTITVTADDTPNASAQQIADAINRHPAARRLVTAAITSGSAGEAGVSIAGTLTTGGADGVTGPIGAVTGLAFGKFHGDELLTSNATSLYGVTDDGKFVTISTGGGPTGRVTDVVDLTVHGITGFQGLSLGPQNLHDGAFKNAVFAITNTGDLMAIDIVTGAPMQAFGSDNEIQQLSLTGAAVAGDSFTLTYQDDYFGSVSTGPITVAAGGTVDAADVQAALLALTTGNGIHLFQAADLNVTGGALPGTAIQIEFQGFYQDKAVSELSVDSTNLSGGASVSVTTVAEGGDGLRNSITVATGASAPTGLAFSPLDFNLWHPTTSRQGVDNNGDGVIDAADTDPGHGVNPTFNLSRFPGGASASGSDDPVLDPQGHEYQLSQLEGGISLYFGLENYVDNDSQPYLNYNEQTLGAPPAPGQARVDRTQFGAGFNDFQRDLTSGTIGDNYDLPGGALGSLLTDPFDLTSTTASDGADVGDRPTLYFNYFLESEDKNTSSEDAQARDTARVFISNNGGRSWELVATNNTPIANSGSGGADATTEVPDFVSHLRTGDAGNPKQQIQPLFDNTGGWRQARIDLSDYHGQTDLRLRFDFSTAGTLVDEVVDAGDSGNIPATANQTNDADLLSPVDEYGNLNDARRGQNNAHEGFYIDDIIIGWSERGEIITGATTNTDFFSVPQDPDPLAPVQSLRGPYQLEIRRGHEYASIPDPLNPGIAISSTFDPNTQFVPGATLGIPSSSDDFESGDFAALNWVVDDGDSPWTVEDNFGNFGIPRTFEAQSGPLDRGDESIMSVSATTGEGLLTFRQFFTPDPGSDDRFLVFIDGENLTGPDWIVTAADGADTGFRNVSIPITAGPHTIEFVYRKLATGTDGAGSVLVDDIIFPSPSGRYIRGDRNIEREQGQFLIHGNLIRDVAEDAIAITAGARDAGTNFPNPGSPINFETLNNQSLVPGVTVSNNVIARFGLNGINLSGEPIIAGVPQAAVPLGKFVNNTIYGSDIDGPSDGTTGIRIESNASPTLLNNLIVNTETGVFADGTSSTTVLARTYFRGNSVEATGVSSTLQITDDPTNQLFVDPLVDNFYLAGDSDSSDGIFDGALPIDRSLAKIDDRTAFVAVTSDLGIAPSPFLSPTKDIFGQTRVDDATQPPSGVGSEVFNDVGAIERADFIGPFATMLAPLDNSVDDQDPANHDVVTLETNFLTRLIVQLSDSGIGVDDAFVTAPQWELKRNDQVLVEGTDYTFIYNPGSDQATFQAVTIFPTDSRYTITLVDRTPETGVRDIAGNPIQANRSNGDVRFEVVLQNGVNDSPVNVTPGAQTTAEDVALVFNQANGNLITVSDPDAFLGDNQMTITLTPTQGSLAPTTVAGVTESTVGTVVTLTGEINKLNQALDGLTFNPDADYFGTASIIVHTDDNGQFSGFPLVSEIDTDTIAITVTPINDAPLIDPIADQAILEDTLTLAVALSGVAAGPSNETEQVQIVSAISSNPLIIPDGTSPSGPSGSIVFSPVPDAFGTVTITVTVEDAGPDDDFATTADNLITTEVFDIVVTDVNDPPVIDAVAPVHINEDEGPGSIDLTGIASGPFNETGDVRLTVVSSGSTLLQNAAITYSSPDATGTLTYDLVPDQFGGPTTLTLTVEDAGPDNILNDDPLTMGDESADNSTTTTTIDVTVDPVNDLPTISAIADETIAEDSGSHNVSLAGIGTGAGNETQPIRVTATSSDPSIIPHPTITHTDPSASGTLTYQPAADAFGTVTLTVQIEDGGLDGDLSTPGDNGITTETFDVTITPTNDAPKIAVIADQSIDEDTGPGSVALTGINAGAANEPGPIAVSASITGGDGSIIDNLAVNYTSLNATGTFTYDLTPDAFGTVEVTIELVDAGQDGVTGNADDLTTSEVFEIVINPVNDAPLLNAIANQLIDEDAGPGTINLTGIDNGPANESENVRFTATSNDTSIINGFSVTYSSLDATGIIEYSLVQDAFGGPVEITVTAEDAGFDGIFDDDAATPLIDESADNAVTLQTLTVTVAPTNDAPTLDTVAPVTVNEDSTETTVNLTGITAGGGESQSLRVTATSDNPSLIANPTVAYNSPDATGSLAFTPLADRFGSATITVFVEDGGLDNNLQTVADNLTLVQTFVVTVNPVNDAPFLAPVSDRTIDEDAGNQDIALMLISAGPNETQALSIAATSDNPSLIGNPSIAFDGTSSTGILTYASLTDQFGSATITVTVTDGGSDNDLSTVADNLSFDQSFTVTVNAVNDAPEITTITSQSVDEDSAESGIPFEGVNAGGGETQEVRITATSSNPSLIPDPTVVYADPDATGELRVQPIANQFGSVVITVLLEDGGLDGDLATAADNATTATSFVLAVAPTNDSPTLDLIADQSADEDSGAKLIDLSGITAGPSENDPMRVTVAFSDPTLIASSAVIYNSPSTTGTLSLTPAADRFGTTTVTVTVEDGGVDGDLTTAGDNGTTSEVFVLTVNPINDAPGFNQPADVTMDEDSSGISVDLTGITAGPDETDSLRITATSGATGLIPDPAVTYTSAGATGTLNLVPVADAFGMATITVQIEDAGPDDDFSTAADNLTFSQSFTVNVTNLPDSPVPIDDTAETTEDNVVLIRAADLLANDIDPDLGPNSGEVLSVVIPTPLTGVSAKGASVTYDPSSGDITYDPTTSLELQALSPNESVQDSFVYAIEDADGEANPPTATVFLNVAGINDAPTVVNDEVASPETLDPVIIKPLANDFDVDGTLVLDSIIITRDPLFGSIAKQINAAGELELAYSPFAVITGEDSFAYTISDNLGQASAQATVNIMPDPRPQTGADVGGGQAITGINIDVLSNDVPVNGQLDQSTLTIVDQPEHGTVAIESDGTISYVPDAGFIGTDSFSYTIADTEGNVSEPTSVQVNSVSNGLQNPVRFRDVNASGEITALDALLIINRLNRAVGNTVPVNPTDQGPNYFDVNGNGEITALDALLVINRIGQSAAAGEGESVNPPASGQLESVQRASTQPVLGLPASAPRVSADDEDAFPNPLATNLVPSGVSQERSAFSGTSEVTVDLIDLIAGSQQDSQDDESLESVNDAALRDLF